MSAQNTTRWIGIGLLGLPLYGVLTFWSSIDPQPDPNTHLEAWSRFVTTNHYVWGHLLGILLAFVGNVLLGVAVFRSGTLPRSAGTLWVVSVLVFYVLGAVLGIVITGASLPTQPVGALLMAISGGAMAYSALRQRKASTVGVQAQPSMQ